MTRLAHQIVEQVQRSLVGGVQVLEADQYGTSRGQRAQERQRRRKQARALGRGIRPRGASDGGLLAHLAHGLDQLGGRHGNAGRDRIAEAAIT